MPVQIRRKSVYENNDLGGQDAREQAWAEYARVERTRVEIEVAVMAATPPHPVDNFVKAVNRGDTEAFLAFFPQDGVVNDWGRQFTGHDEIRQWSDNEFIGAGGTMTPNEVTQDGDEIVVVADWRSNHANGLSRFASTVDGEQIQEMRITGA